MPDWRPLVRRRLADAGDDGARRAEVVDEVAAHLDDRYRELLAQGASEDEARRAAEAEVALGIRLVRRRGRAMGDPEVGAPTRLLAGLGRDIRFGLRSVRRNPGFAAVAVLSLALGTGANSALFQLLDAVRLRRLPVRAPNELAVVQISDLKGLTGSFDGLHPEFTNAIWERVRDRQTAFAGTYAWGTETFNLAAGGEIRAAQGLWVSGGFFPTLGVGAEAGRLLGLDDDEPGCRASAVVSDAFWRHEFGADPDILHRTVQLDGVRIPIVGVTLPSFFGVEVGRRFDVVVPLCAEPLVHRGRSRLPALDFWWLAIGGRLKPGWTLDRASAAVRSISPAIFAETLPPSYSPNQGAVFRSYHLGATSGAGGRSALRGAYSSPLWFLLGIGSLVLLIACANLANLQLARGTAREREIAARLAVGASRGRLLRQLSIESLVLASLGVALGVALGQAVTRGLVAMLSTADAPLFLDLAPSGRLFAFSALVAVATALGFGLLPAVRATRLGPAGALRRIGRGLTTAREGRRLQQSLVVVQVALSTVLLVAALLFVRSFRNLLTLDPGFRYDGVLVARLDLSRLDLPPARRQLLLDDLIGRLDAVPGVRAASNDVVPVSDDWNNTTIEVDGPTGRQSGVVDVAVVSPEYFRTMETTLLRGRDFSARDRQGTAPVAIVNEAFSTRFFSGTAPIGRTFRIPGDPGRPATTFQVVGLVTNTKHRSLRESFRPLIFFSAGERGVGRVITLFVRGTESMTTLTPTVRRVVEAANPAIDLQLWPLRVGVREGLLQDRLLASLSGFFGVLAVILAAIGLYGVMSYLLARRTNEMGIRLALGADRGAIVRMVLTESLRTVAVGLALGTAATVAAGGVAGSMLYGLSPRDPAAFVIAIGSLVAVGLFVVYLPARRAARVDPIEALRSD